MGLRTAAARRAPAGASLFVAFCHRKLRGVLESSLTNLRVLRIGEIEVQVYLIGKTPGGSWAGLHTVSVET